MLFISVGIVSKFFTIHSLTPNCDGLRFFVKFSEKYYTGNSPLLLRFVFSKPYYCNFLKIDLVTL